MDIEIDKNYCDTTDLIEENNLPGRPSSRFADEKIISATRWAIDRIPVEIHKKRIKWTPAEYRILDVIATRYNYSKNLLKIDGLQLSSLALVSRKTFYNVIKRLEAAGFLSVSRKKSSRHNRQEINIYRFSESVAYFYARLFNKLKQIQKWFSGSHKLKTRGKSFSQVNPYNLDSNINTYKQEEQKQSSIAKNQLGFDWLVASREASRNRGTSSTISKGTGVRSDEHSFASAPVWDENDPGQGIKRKVTKAVRKSKTVICGKSSKACQRGEIRNFSAIMAVLKGNNRLSFWKRFREGVKILNPAWADKLAQNVENILEICEDVRRKWFKDLHHNRFWSMAEKDPVVALLALIQTALRCKLKRDVGTPAGYLSAIVNDPNPRPDISINNFVNVVAKEAASPDSTASGFKAIREEAIHWLSKLPAEIQQKLYQKYARDMRSPKDRPSFSFDCPHWKLRAFKWADIDQAVMPQSQQLKIS